MSFEPSYLHYYFNDFETSLSLADFNAAKRKELLKSQLKSFKKNKEDFLEKARGYGGEFEVLADFLDDGSAAGQKMRQMVYDSAVYAKNAKLSFEMSGVNGETFSSLGELRAYLNKKGREIDQIPDKDILPLIENFQKALTKMLEEAIRQTGINMKDFEQQVISNYLAYKEIPDGEKANAILSDFLAHDGLKSFKKHLRKKGIVSDSSSSSIASLILLANALPSGEEGSKIKSITIPKDGYLYSTSRTKKDPKSITTLKEFLDKIASKSFALYTNISGKAGEIAAGKAEIDLLTKFLLEHDKVLQNQLRSDSSIADRNVSGLGFTVQKIGDDTVNLVEEDFRKNVRAKGDTVVSMTRDSVKASYALSVKSYTVDPNTNSARVDIIKETPFLTSARRVLGDNGAIIYAYHAASAHAGKGRRTGREGNSDASLTATWEEIKETVVTGNLLSYMAGLPSENVFYVVVNKDVFDIGTCLERMIENLDDGNRIGIYTEISKDISREKLKKSNVWKKASGSKSSRSIPGRDMERKAAIERSTSAIASLESQLRKAKITVSMNFVLTK